MGGHMLVLKLTTPRDKIAFESFPSLTHRLRLQ